MSGWHRLLQGNRLLRSGVLCWGWFFRAGQGSGTPPRARQQRTTVTNDALRPFKLAPVPPARRPAIPPSSRNPRPAGWPPLRPTPLPRRRPSWRASWGRSRRCWRNCCAARGHLARRTRRRRPKVQPAPESAHCQQARASPHSLHSPLAVDLPAVPCPPAACLCSCSRQVPCPALHVMHSSPRRPVLPAAVRAGGMAADAATPASVASALPQRTEAAASSAVVNGSAAEQAQHGEAEQPEHHTPQRPAQQQAPPSPGAETPVPPPHPASYMQVLEMLEKGQTPPGIRVRGSAQGHEGGDERGGSAAGRAAGARSGKVAGSAAGRACHDKPCPAWPLPATP